LYTWYNKVKKSVKIKLNKLELQKLQTDSYDTDERMEYNHYKPAILTFGIYLGTI